MIDIQEIQKAIVLTQKGEFKLAESIYLNLLEKYPKNEILLSAMGLFYTNLGDLAKAKEYLQEACSIKETLGTLSAIGFVEFECKNFEKAVEYLEKSLIYGNHEDVYNKLILSLFQIKSYKKAISYSEKMYELYPNDYRAVANMVKSLTQQGKLRQAEQLCVEKLGENSNIPVLWFHLGFLKELIYSNDKQAKECYKVAAELGSPEAFYNIAVSCQKLGEYADAEIYYKKMLEFYPNDKDTITSLGMCYLKQKKFKEGYELFFQRDKSRLAKYTQNPWQPNDVFNNEIVVICDQGYGDHIQFIRYLPCLLNAMDLSSNIQSKTIKVAAPEVLRELFKNNYPQVDFIDYEMIEPQTQSLRVSDLPYALNMDFDNIPYADGYLNVEVEKISNEKLKVGLCWEAGNAGIRTMINRTINVSCFEPLFQLNSVQVYSFQVQDTLDGNSKYPQMINLAKDFKNFYDTAKALKSMDVFITVDTSVAHLAGALGVKTFLLLPYSSDWRWFDDFEKTPWYNSVKIFKQTDSISWEKEINDVIANII